MGPEVCDLQSLVLKTFALIERGIETLIIWRIIKDAGVEFNSPGYDNLNGSLSGMLDCIMFRQKIKILYSFTAVPEEIKKMGLKAYEYRNEFAHPSGNKLEEKYNYNTVEGKINIKRLQNTIHEAYYSIDDYFAELLGQKKKHNNE